MEEQLLKYLLLMERTEFGLQRRTQVFWHNTCKTENLKFYRTNHCSCTRLAALLSSLDYIQIAFSSEILPKTPLREIEDLIKKMFPGSFKFSKRNLRRNFVGSVSCLMLVRQAYAQFIRDIGRLFAVRGNLQVTNTLVLQRGSLISLVLCMRAGNATTSMMIFHAMFSTSS